MTATVELQLCGPMDHLRIAWQTGETLLESVSFAEDPQGTRYNVLLAVQEMLTNVLRHGYGGDDSRPVIVAFDVAGDGIGIAIRDRGPSFDPTEVDLAPDGDAFPTTEGGYGIMIARMVMDELSYRRDGEWNVLEMFKSGQPAAQELRS